MTWIFSAESNARGGESMYSEYGISTMCNSWDVLQELAQGILLQRQLPVRLQ